MNLDAFFLKIRTFIQLGTEAEAAWKTVLAAKHYRRGEVFLPDGAVSSRVAFVLEGMLYQYYQDDEGNTVIKDFFHENRIAASYSALLSHEPNPFAIEALEDTYVVEYDFFQFKKLTVRYQEIADFYVTYMEQHYIPERESCNKLFRFQTARERYQAFVKQFPELLRRLKKRHVAAYLGIGADRLATFL